MEAIADSSGWRARLAVPRCAASTTPQATHLEECMRNQFGRTAAACALAVACLAGAGQRTDSGAGGSGCAGRPVSSAVAAPTYISIPLEIAVNRPAADVWKRVGKFCDIGEWLRIPCTITSGKDGEFGAVRSVASEVLVGKTELSYTYTQPVQGRPAVQPLSRHARGEAGDADDLEDRLHPVLRQLDAGRRCRARSGQGAKDRRSSRRRSRT